ncbi:SIMPL domain-containing protein [Undibacterium danionis]|uniref:SIMPL domain-containing protein n=2 Tax=Undibacterium danionis TaxID=1812100 RepID=A0ABV6IJW5_9BURK
MKIVSKGLCALISLMLTSSVIASSLPTYPFIHATGEATLSMRPDLGEIDFELTELSADPEMTFSMLEKASAEVITFLASQGLSSDDIEAADIKRFVSDVEYADATDAPKKFRLLRNFHIVIRDLQKWNMIIAGLLAKPFVGNFSVNFGRSDMDKIQNDLVIMATTNAKDNAKRLAQGLSVRLGIVGAVSQSPLKSISTLLGLDGAIKREEQAVQHKPTTKDFYVPTWLKYKQNVDVVFRIKP